MIKRKNQEDVIKEIESENYKVINIDYKNQKSKIEVQHLECSHIFKIDYNHWHNRNQRCPKCRKYSQKKSNEEFLEKIKELHLEDKYEFLSEYENKRSKVKVKCKDCGNQFEILPGNIYNGSCKFCAAINRGNRQKLTLEKIDDELKEKFDCKLISTEYKNNKEVLFFECNKCGNQFETSLTNLRGGTRCPKCYERSSLSEEEVKTFLKEIGIKAEKFYMKLNNRRNEIDIYSEEHKVGIEFNGLYWHSDKFKSNSSMKEKLIWANSNKIRLINIFEDEWKFKKDIVKDKLKSIFGLTKNKIYARDCVIKNITLKEKDKFLEENHIQGKDKSNCYSGLFYENELVAVMSFCKLRRSLGFKESPNGTYELSRFAGKLGISVVGGFSKLLKYSIKTYKIDKIITYADLRWSSLEENVYIKNGFNLDHISAPSYSYLDKNFKKRFSRFKFRKNNLKKLFPNIYDDQKSESDIMKEAGYFRIYDCGNAVYILETKK